VGHWAPIESVVNPDGPDKSVIIPSLLCRSSNATAPAVSLTLTRYSITLGMPAAAWLMYKSAYVYIYITEGSVKSSE
jgi:hypothetical protein